MLEGIGEFTLGKTLGAGAFSQVKLGIHHETGLKVAIKIIDKKLMEDKMSQAKQKQRERDRKKAVKEGGQPIPIESIEQTRSPIESTPPRPFSPGLNTTAANLNTDPSFLEKFQLEVKIMMRLDHPNILRIYQVIDSEAFCYVVLELAQGGELVNYIASRDYLIEKEARRLFRQLLSAMDHCHQAGVVHRDLKLDNILLTQDRNVLISDFGLGRFAQHVDTLNTFCGTPSYAAVELVSGIPYVGAKTDIWALGVILFIMTAGKPPFAGENIAQLYKKIKSVDYTTPFYFSNELNDLFARIFTKDPKFRISMDELMVHPWVMKDAEPIVRISPRFDNSNSVPLSQYISGVSSVDGLVIYKLRESRYANGSSVNALPANSAATSSAVMMAKRAAGRAGGGTHRRTQSYNISPGVIVNTMSREEADSRVEEVTVIRRHVPYAIGESQEEQPEEPTMDAHSNFDMAHSEDRYIPLKEKKPSGKLELPQLPLKSSSSSIRAPDKNGSANSKALLLGANSPPIIISTDLSEEVTSTPLTIGIEAKPRTLRKVHHKRSVTSTNAMEMKRPAFMSPLSDQAHRDNQLNAALKTLNISPVSINGLASPRVASPGTDLSLSAGSNTKSGSQPNQTTGSSSSDKFGLVRKMSHLNRLNQLERKKSVHENSIKSPGGDREREIIRRMVNVSPSRETLEINNVSSSNSIANPQIASHTFEPNENEILNYHTLHTPASEIRVIRFALNPKLTSHLSPSTCFQEVHRVVAALAAEYASIGARFRWSRPDIRYYCMQLNFEPQEKPLRDINDISNMASEEMIEDHESEVSFEIEVCKVWLLKLHSLRSKRTQGNPLLFKMIMSDFTENWMKPSA